MLDDGRVYCKRIEMSGERQCFVFFKKKKRQICPLTQGCFFRRGAKRILFSPNALKGPPPSISYLLYCTGFWIYQLIRRIDPTKDEFTIRAQKSFGLQCTMASEAPSSGAEDMRSLAKNEVLASIRACADTTPGCMVRQTQPWSKVK